MEIVPIKGNTFAIDTGMTCIPFYKIDEKRIVMLDTGWGQGERGGIEALLKKEDLRVEGIIHSHLHIDHIGSSAYFRKKYGSTIAMPAFEAMLCSSPENMKVYFDTQTLLEVQGHYGDLVLETDVLIEKHWQTVYLCGVLFRLVSMPGHSPAQICIITPDHVAYVADALISEEVMAGAKVPYADILSVALESMEKIKGLKADLYIVAHKGIYHEIASLAEKNIFFYKERAAKIAELIHEPMTMEQIMEKVIDAFQIRITTVNRYRVVERMLHSFVEYLHDTKVIGLRVDSGFLKYSPDFVLIEQKKFDESQDFYPQKSPFQPK